MEDRIRIPIGTGDYLVESMISKMKPDQNVSLRVQSNGLKLVMSRPEQDVHTVKMVTIDDFKYAKAILDVMEKELDEYLKEMRD
jgi:hypothetical protein